MTNMNLQRYVKAGFIFKSANEGYRRSKKSKRRLSNQELKDVNCQIRVADPEPIRQIRVADPDPTCQTGVVDPNPALAGSVL